MNVKTTCATGVEAERRESEEVWSRRRADYWLEAMVMSLLPLVKTDFSEI